MHSLAVSHALLLLFLVPVYSLYFRTAKSTVTTYLLCDRQYNLTSTLSRGNDVYFSIVAPTVSLSVTDNLLAPYPLGDNYTDTPHRFYQQLSAAVLRNLPTHQVTFSDRLPVIRTSKCKIDNNGTIRQHSKYPPAGYRVLVNTRGRLNHSTLFANLQLHIHSRQTATHTSVRVLRRHKSCPMLRCYTLPVNLENEGLPHSN